LQSESSFVAKGLLLFLEGSSDAVHYLDPNHVAKALRNQIVLGSSLLCVGSHHVDPGLLLLAGVDLDLVRVRDFASDLSVLKLCSVETLKKLNDLVEEENAKSVAVTGITLFFLRLFVMSANATGLDKSRACHSLWCGLLWFTSTRGTCCLLAHSKLFGYCLY